MEIPCNDVVQIADAVVIPAGTSSTPGTTLVTFQVADTVSDYVIQVTTSDTFNYPNNVGVQVYASLDEVNYVQSVVGTEVGSTGSLSQIAGNNNSLGKYFRLTGWNNDTINHTVNVWLIAK